jgi:maltose alpha-D-glucosyltransferase/alpha-amylase
LKFTVTPAFAALAGDAPESLPVKRLALDSSNTTLAIGERLLMKGYRCLQSGISPELEMGRFLTEIAFPNIAPLAGALEYEDAAGDRITLVLLQGFMENQGDAWSYSQDYLKRFLTDCLEQPDRIREAGENAHTVYLLFAATLGQAHWRIAPGAGANHRRSGFRPGTDYGGRSERMDEPNP